MLKQTQATTENGSEDPDRRAVSSLESHAASPHGSPGGLPVASPTAELPVSASDEASDSGRGLLLFLTFVTAILVMVLAVWLAATVGQWWILIPVVAVDLIATTAVMGVVIWMLGDGANPAQPDIRALPSIPGVKRAPGGNGYADEPAQAA